MGNSKTKIEQTDSKETESSNQHSSSVPQIQIRNCVRNVRGSNNNFSDMYPNEPGTSCGLYFSFIVYSLTNACYYRD